ncbi:hypothetical protein IWQ61_006185 [Dispira simplex]|nr:hypothetical protein IWQ61_006185 [Dispira simplex]
MNCDIDNEAIRVLQETSQALQACAQRLQQARTHLPDQPSDFRRAVELLYQSVCQGGKVVITGVGKSGKIGQKLVATFLSINILAMFLHPTEALHGDLGMVSPRDTVLALSYSGKTEEVLAVVPFVRQRGAHLVGLGGEVNSPLGHAVDAWLDARVSSEATPEIPAPTVSTTVALAVGDALAVCLMQLCACTPQIFSSNHPGGALGRALKSVSCSKLATASHPSSVSQIDPLEHHRLVSSDIDPPLVKLSCKVPQTNVSTLPSVTNMTSSLFHTPPDSPPNGGPSQAFVYNKACS